LIGYKQALVEMEEKEEVETKEAESNPE